MKTVSKCFKLNIIIFGIITGCNVGSILPTNVTISIEEKAIEDNITKIVADHCTTLATSKTKDTKALLDLLASLKENILRLFEEIKLNGKSLLPPKYVELEQQLIALKPHNILNVLTTCQAVLSNLPKEAKEMICESLPPVLRRAITEKQKN